MKPIHEPTATQAEADRLRDGDGLMWEAIYQSLLAELTAYVDIAVARALAARAIAAVPGVSPEHKQQATARSYTSESGESGKSRLLPPFDPAPLPPWLQPFTLPENVRFTRTPDPILRGEWVPISEPSSPIAAAPERQLLEAVPPEPARTSSNVRFNRAPRPKPAEKPLAGYAADVAPAAPPAAVEEAVPVEAAMPVEAAAPAASPACAPDVAPRRSPAWLEALRIEGIESLQRAQEQDNWQTLDNSAIAPIEEAELAEVAENGEQGDAFFEALTEPPAALVAYEEPDGAQDLSDVSRVFQPEAVRAPAAPPPVVSPMRSAGLTLSAPINRMKADLEKAPPAEPLPWEAPALDLLVEPPAQQPGVVLSSGALEQNARLLEGVLEEFGVRGEIIDVRPGPVVTLYELEPAPGTKSSRVIGLSDDIARSMSAVSARVAVVQGRNVIGIELPNQHRETVYLSELVGSPDFISSKHKLAIALGKTIGGEPIIVDLARMPHLLVAGTTGSGKSVAINTMILSLLYRLKPEECRLIMIDPKMLELSVYEGIPHLLTPVVTDPKKAVVALKWAVREMEDRYKKMAKVGVRNIDGFNVRVAEANRRGEVITRTVQTGFNRETGEPIFEREEISLQPLPYIVLIVDEMADLMMVAGKDIESAIQRLAQMARAAGIHLITATQRPSVDVITGTIKANFPTRVSFQVTSKIDSRTILGEQGAEQLLGQGDMLYMAGGGRIRRVHGPFVSDDEVEKIVAHLKTQGHPAYLDVVVADEDGSDSEPDAPESKAIFERSSSGGDEDGELYDQAVKVVLRDKKCSTSYIQRRLQVGYNKAASLVERMEKEGLVGQANNAGKREILVYSRDLRYTEPREDD
jgi:S-DNA-T family DNA segregation ATPase FtsK/SpoIIIE